MSRSHWLPYVAAIGILLGGSVCAQPVDKNSRAQDATTQRQKPSDKNERNDLEAFHADLERIRAAIEANKPEKASNEEQDRARRDLQAQEQMAFWARWSTYASFIQTALGTLGFVLLILTLWANIKATRAAVRSNELIQEGRRPWADFHLMGKKEFEWKPKQLIELDVSLENAGESIINEGHFVSDLFVGGSDKFPGVRDVIISRFLQDWRSLPGIKVMPKKIIRQRVFFFLPNDIPEKIADVDDIPTAINIVLLFGYTDFSGKPTYYTVKNYLVQIRPFAMRRPSGDFAIHPSASWFADGVRTSYA